MEMPSTTILSLLERFKSVDEPAAACSCPNRWANNRHHLPGFHGHVDAVQHGQRAEMLVNVLHRQKGHGM